MKFSAAVVRHDESVGALAALGQAGPVERLCERYVDDLAVLDPVLATHLGVTADDAALTGSVCASRTTVRLRAGE